MTGFYRKEPLKFLVDNGSTFNFLKGSVVRRLKLPTVAVTPFRVLTGSGAYLTCAHQCKAISFVIQDIKLVADFFCS